MLCCVVYVYHCAYRVDAEKQDRSLSKYVAMGPELQPLHLDQLR
jgi:hypothetical protein